MDKRRPAGAGFPAFYFLYFMASAVTGNFLPLYLGSNGLSNTEIANVLSLGCFVALAAQPLWGWLSDRAANRVTVLRLLVLATAGTAFLFLASTRRWSILAAMAVFTFFQSPVSPLMDSASLETITGDRRRYGIVKLMGTLGWAFCALLGGFVIAGDERRMFPLYAILALAAAGVTFILPGVPGHQARRRPVSPLRLFRNRELAFLFMFVLALYIPLAAYNTFFAVFFRAAGASDQLVGWAFCIGSLSEIPFLLSADRIVGRLGVKNTMFIAAGATIVRYLILSLVHNPYAILATQILHGMVYVPLAYAISMYINTEAPPELKSSGQALYSMLSLGVAKIIGNWICGFLSDTFSLGTMFLIAAAMMAVTLAAFSFLLRKPAAIRGGNQPQV